jgi:hypothetical protein
MAALFCGGMLPRLASASGEGANPWQFEAALYVYLPTLSGSSAFPPEDGSDGISIDTSKILENLKMTFMGSFQARHDPWGAFTDLIYIDLGNSKTVSRGFSIGGMPLPSTVTANTDLDIRGWLWTLAGTYRPVSTEQQSLDVLAGIRLLDIREKITWQLGGDTTLIPPPDRAGFREATPSNWDAIAGVKGRITLGPDRKWFALYYADLGAGQSKFTTQLMGGGGYAFHWGEVLAAWRYIDYQLKSGENLERLGFSGPLVAVQFRW